MIDPLRPESVRTGKGQETRTMKNGLMLHCGGEAVTEKDLDLFPVPQETATYKPVSHFELVKQIKLVSQDLLTLRSGGDAFTLERESFGVAREGKQMFGVLTFVNSEISFPYSRPIIPKASSSGIGNASNDNRARCCPRSSP